MVRHGRGFPMQPVSRPPQTPPRQGAVYVIAQLGKDGEPTCYLMDVTIRTRRVRRRDCLD